MLEKVMRGGEFFTCVFASCQGMKSIPEIMQDALKAHRDGYATNCIVAFPDGKQTIRFFEREKALKIAFMLEKAGIKYALLRERN